MKYRALRIFGALICLGIFAAPMGAQAVKPDGSDKTAPGGSNAPGGTPVV